MTMDGSTSGDTQATLPDSAYVPLMTCTPPDPRRGVGKALPLDYSWTCPDHGELWTIQYDRSPGGVNAPRWSLSADTTTPPGTADAG